MKKLITAAALTAFALASTAALADDASKKNTAAEKTPAQQQTETQSTGGAKMMKPSATTGAASNMQMNSTVKPGESTVPGKPTDTVNQETTKGK